NLCLFNDTATTEIYTLSLHDALPINDTATTEIYTLSLHDALPISVVAVSFFGSRFRTIGTERQVLCRWLSVAHTEDPGDRVCSAESSAQLRDDLESQCSTPGNRQSWSGGWIRRQPRCAPAVQGRRLRHDVAAP